jgi:hypothetical protein
MPLRPQLDTSVTLAMIYIRNYFRNMKHAHFAPPGVSTLIMLLGTSYPVRGDRPMQMAFRYSR